MGKNSKLDALMTGLLGVGGLFAGSTFWAIQVEAMFRTSMANLQGPQRIAQPLLELGKIISSTHYPKEKAIDILEKGRRAQENAKKEINTIEDCVKKTQDVLRTWFHISQETFNEFEAINKDRSNLNWDFLGIKRRLLESYNEVKGRYIEGYIENEKRLEDPNLSQRSGKKLSDENADSRAQNPILMEDLQASQKDEITPFLQKLIQWGERIQKFRQHVHQDSAAEPDPELEPLANELRSLWARAEGVDYSQVPARSVLDQGEKCLKNVYEKVKKQGDALKNMKNVFCLWFGVERDVWSEIEHILVHSTELLRSFQEARQKLSDMNSQDAYFQLKSGSSSQARTKGKVTEIPTPISIKPAPSSTNKKKVTGEKLLQDHEDNPILMGDLQKRDQDFITPLVWELNELGQSITSLYTW